jgi:RNA polymerase sigma-70 factor (ECF subfamily)
MTTEVFAARGMAGRSADAAALPDPVVHPRDFATFYLESFPRLVRYVLRLTGDPEVARDVAQEALTRTFTRWLGVRNKEGYVYLVATNLVRDIWSRQRRERDALVRYGASATTVASPDLAVRDAVERLPERLRDIVILHYFADLSVEQIARAVKRPTGTVKQRLHAARVALATTLGERDA